MREESRYQKAYFVIGIITIVTYIYYYLRMRPFWLDECFLALATMDSSYLDLFKPLTWSQVAPPIYLVICQLIYKLNIMPIELSYRLYSLIAGIGSVIIFVPFAKKFIKDNKLILISYLLYCSNFWIAYYTQEYKQYSSDIFLGMGSYLLCEKWLKLEKSKVRLWIEGSILGFISFISQTSLFIIIAYLGTLFFKEVLQVKPKIKINIKKLGHLIITGIGFALPVIVMMALIYFKNPNQPYMMNWWLRYGGFLDFNTLSLSYLYFRILEFLFNCFSIYFVYFIHIILFPIFLFQIICPVKNRKIDFKSIFLSILFLGVIMSSFLKVFPAIDRLILWTFPFWLMLMMRFLQDRKQKVILFCLKSIFYILICNNIILLIGYCEPFCIRGSEEEDVSYSVEILKEKSDVIPVFMERYVIFDIEGSPDHKAVYLFNKKKLNYQPAEEMIIPYTNIKDWSIEDFKNPYITGNRLWIDEQKLTQNVKMLCEKYFKGRFENGKKYGFIAFEDELSKECQDYFLGLGGHMEGPVYIWVHPEK